MVFGNLTPALLARLMLVESWTGRQARATPTKRPSDMKQSGQHPPTAPSDEGKSNTELTDAIARTERELIQRLDLF